MTFKKTTAAGVTGSSIRSDASAAGIDNAVDDRTDDSASDVAASDAATSNAAASDVASHDSRALVEAATVIRDSRSGSVTGEGSRSDVPEPGDRSPTAVAGVLVGHRLNHFFLEKIIGGGGMGAVFRARDEQLDRTVAVKVVPFANSDTDLLRRFRNEAQSAAKLDHPHIAQVFDVGSDAHWHYIVFEYIRGINLRDLVHRDGVLSVDDAVLYTIQLADALRHAASRGITHRDVKPSNVVLTAGRIKLVDMGLARSEKYDLSADMTASGVTLGTFDYISPEQARDPRDADIRSDLYSLGCTLYFMLTGRPPYPGGTMLQKLLAHGSDPPPDIRKARSGMSEELAEVIQRLLAKEPGDRYQTPHQLIDALQGIASRSSLRRLRRDTTVPTVAPWQRWVVSPQGQTWLPWILGLTILIAIAMVLQLQSSWRDFEVAMPGESLGPLVNNAPVQSLDRESNTASISDASPIAVTPSNASPLDSFIPSASSPAGMDPVASLGGEGATNSTATPRSLLDGSASSAAGDPSSVAANPSTRNFAVDATAMVPSATLGGQSTLSPSPTGRIDSPLREVFEVDPQGDAVVVTDAAGFHPLHVSTLAEAISLANRQGIKTIDLAMNQIVSGPVRLSGNDLLIRSSVGGTTIVFIDSTSTPDNRSIRSTPPMDAPPMGDERTTSDAMIDSTVGQLELQDVHLQWTVGRQRSLLRVYEGELVNLTDCVVTVRRDLASMRQTSATGSSEQQAASGDVSDLLEGPLRLQSGDRPELFRTTPGATTSPNDVDFENVAVIEIANGQLRGDGVGPSTLVDLNNVVVRGQTDMVHATNPGRLDLGWDNGLLAISGAMVRLDGGDESPTADQSVELSLQQLVVDAASGLVRLDLDEDRIEPIKIFRSARRSVFVVRESRPQILVSGSQQMRQPSEFLMISGSRNAFDSDPTLTDPIVRIVTTDGTTQTVSISEVVSTSDPWLREIEPRMSVRWTLGDRPDGAWDLRHPSQYQFADDSLRGFDKKWLPPAALYVDRVGGGP